MDTGPSRWERIAYRGLGVRLDDRWRSWVEQDLDDPRWIRRHRLAQLATFGVLGAFIFWATGTVLGEVPWQGSGGFLGALLGQLGFAQLKNSQTRRAQLSPNRPWISVWLPFPHRVVLTMATLVLLLSATVAGAFAIREDDASRPASPFERRQIDGGRSGPTAS